MTPSFYKTYTEYCPFVEDEQTISLRYDFVPILGSPFKNYRAFSFECPDRSECTLEKCPIHSSHLTLKK